MIWQQKLGQVCPLGPCECTAKTRSSETGVCVCVRERECTAGTISSETGVCNVQQELDQVRQLGVCKYTAGTRSNETFSYV